MKIALKKFDEEDLEAQNFVKFRNKKHKLTGKQSITQLGLLTENESDPAARFENTDLNELYQMDYLDGLISGIKTGKGSKRLYIVCVIRGLLNLSYLLDINMMIL